MWYTLASVLSYVTGSIIVNTTHVVCILATMCYHMLQGL